MALRMVGPSTFQAGKLKQDFAELWAISQLALQARLNFGNIFIKPLLKHGCEIGGIAIAVAGNALEAEMQHEGIRAERVEAENEYQHMLSKWDFEALLAELRQNPVLRAEDNLRTIFAMEYFAEA